jgi:hypothetical protein
MSKFFDYGKTDHVDIESSQPDYEYYKKIISMDILESIPC